MSQATSYSLRGFLTNWGTNTRAWAVRRANALAAL